MSLHDFLFPLPEREEIECMRLEYENSGEDIYAFMGLKYLPDNEPYVECFIWDKRDMQGGYERFVVSDKFYWTTEEEYMFKFYVIKNPMISGYDHNILYDESMRAYPEVNLKAYMNMPLMTILHLYYCLHWAYPEERLFKSQLGMIAFRLQEISDIRREGNSPAEMFDLPMKLLRLCNTDAGVERLICTKEKRNKLKQLYYAHQNLFTNLKGELSYGQCKYIEAIVNDEIEVTKETYLILDNLKIYNNSYSYDSYMTYLNFRNRMKPLKIKLPIYRIAPELVDITEKAKEVLGYLEQENIINRRLQRIWDLNAPKLEVENEKYVLRMPRTLTDILSACEQLNNCLWSYVERLTNEKVYILFIVDKAGELVKGAIEIPRRSNCIVQALGQYNNQLNSEMLSFLSEYAKSKGLVELYKEDYTYDDDDWYLAIDMDEEGWVVN